MKQRTQVLISMMLVVVLFAIGCQGVLNGESKHSVQVPKEPKVVRCEPGKWGGTLKLALSGGPLTFNPFFTSSPETYEVTSKLFGTLLDYDYVNQKPLDDGLARSVDLVDDKTYVIHLREGVNFSDGSPLTADDVIFSFQICLSNRYTTRYRGLMSIDGQPPTLTKEDKLTVRISFPKHYEPIRTLLAQVPIVSQNSLSDSFLKGTFRDAYRLGTAPDKIVSSGPFMVSEIKDDRLELKYNPYYWKVDSSGISLPYVDGVTYLLKTSRQQQAENLLTKGELHIAQVLPKDLPKFSGNPRFVAKNLGASLNSWQLVFNWRSDKTKIIPFKSTWFRTSGFLNALGSTIDRNRLIKDVVDGMGRISDGPVNASNETWHNPNVRKVSYDMGTARQDLSRLSFSTSPRGDLRDPGNNIVRFKIIHLNEYVPTQIANRVTDDLKKLGVEVENSPYDHRKFWELLNKGLFDVALVEVIPPVADPAFLQPYLYKEGDCFWFYDVAERITMADKVEVWMNRINTALNDSLQKTALQERKELYFKVQEDWANRAPILYLMSEDVLVTAQSNVGNFRPARIGAAATWNMEEFYLKN
jgi:peptide/nickel transport system substrate-binding protein